MFRDNKKNTMERDIGGAFLPQVKEVKIFLTVFDEDFNLISEGEVLEFN
ncbi:hypothetical protein ACFSKL_08115 [Belliella marina]|uniref:Uncharacterized protein n=1 Tax=Belliella marina TaxID=1644146 RepID=A0ABW4VJ75_9BACT